MISLRTTIKQERVINMNMNYDPKELAKFGALAAHWWDPKGELKTLHHINPIRLAYIQEKIPLQNKRIIDVGCGGGILSESLSSCGAIVTGIDLDPAVIEVAKLHQLESGTKVAYHRESAENMAAMHPEAFDVVTCLEMLEHVPDPQSIVNACARLVKPGGHVFFSTLNRHPKAYLFAILGGEYLFKLLPKNTHDYAKFIKPSELSHWLRQSNLSPQEIKGLSYHPFTHRSRLTDDISVNYFLHAIRPE